MSVIVVSGILSGEVVVALDTLDNTAIGRSSAPPVSLSVTVLLELPHKILEVKQHNTIRC